MELEWEWTYIVGTIYSIPQMTGYLTSQDRRLLVDSRIPCKNNRVNKRLQVSVITVPRRFSMTITIVAAILLLISSSHFLDYQAAHSQMPGSQNFSSLMKNLLGPQKEVSGHYSNPQFGITDIIFPDGWSGMEIPPILGLSVIMHPGSERNQSSSLFSMSSIPFARLK